MYKSINLVIIWCDWLFRNFTAKQYTGVKMYIDTVCMTFTFIICIALVLFKSIFFQRHLELGETIIMTIANESFHEIIVEY